MNIKVEQFCSLATSPSWQAWLYRFDSVLYKSFITRLQSSKGCNQNREIMKSTLSELNKLNANDSLEIFLRKHYPHMIEERKKSNLVFKNYNPTLLTFPRRMIISGDDIERKVLDFVSDKIKYDFIVVDGIAYVEYLTTDDKNIVGRLPASSWQVRRYKSENGR